MPAGVTPPRYRQIGVVAGATLDDTSWTALHRLSAEVVEIAAPDVAARSWAHLEALVAPWSAVLGPATFDQMPRLELVVVRGTFTGNVDLQAAQNHGCVVKNITGYSERSTAEFVLTHALTALRSRDDGARELAGTTVGIVGIGAVGSLVADCFSRLGADVCWTAKTARRSAPGRHLPLPDLLEQSSIVSYHTPPFVPVLTRRLLGRVRPGAVHIVTTLGLPFAADVQWRHVAELPGTLILDRCAMMRADLPSPPLETVRLIPVVAGRTTASTRRAGLAVIDAIRSHERVR